MTYGTMCPVAGTVQIAFSGLHQGKLSTLTQRHVRQTLDRAWESAVLKIVDASSGLRGKYD
jgi:hypothetical protein